MALGTYTELKAALETWLSRQGDANISTNAADLISLAEARMNRDLPLRVMQTTTTLTGTPGSRSVALPTDFIEPYALFLTTSGTQTMLTPLVAGNFEFSTGSGTPSGWCVNGDNIDLDILCDQAHTFSFRYRKSFALSDDDPTNHLLTKHPDVYLAACMVEAWMLTMNLEMVAPWEQKFQAAVSSIAWVDSRSIAVAPLQVDAAIASPSGFNIYTGG